MDVINKYPHAVTDSGDPLFDKDTFYTEIESEKFRSGTIDRLFGAQKKSSQIISEGFSYKLEREMLNLLIDKIFEKNSDRFQDREDVFEVFAKGMMTGNILPLGKLIDKTFGSGTLRKIGELDQDIKLQIKFVNSL